MNARIGILLDSRDIEELAAEDAEVLGMWGKAARSYRSAGVPGLDGDPDARFTLYYQSALQGATAIVRAAGYRVRGDHNHQITFATVAALGAGRLSDAARDLNVIRQGRHAAIYDWEATIGPTRLRTCGVRPPRSSGQRSDGCRCSGLRSRSAWTRRPNLRSRPL